MNDLGKIFLWFIVINFSVCVRCTICKFCGLREKSNSISYDHIAMKRENLNENCDEIWTNGAHVNGTIFSLYRRSKPDDSIFIANWQWSYNTLGKWSLYYKEWPKKATQTGGFMLTLRRRHMVAKLDWKAYNGMVVWTASYRQPFEYEWNATICTLSLPIKFESNLRGWRFHLGNVLLTGNKSGILRLNGTRLLKYKEEGVRTSLDRKKRETEDLSEEQKKTVWNKIKGYFKELYDQGDNDQRSWLKRVGDWVLGFLERILT